MNYCWLNGTYFWPLNAPLASTDELKQLKETNGLQINRYYVLFPLFYLFMAGCLFLPDTYWRIMSNRSGWGLSKLLLAIKRCDAQLSTHDRNLLIQNCTHCLKRQMLYSKLYQHAVSFIICFCFFPTFTIGCSGPSKFAGKFAH